MGHMLGAARRDELGERQAGNPGEGKVDDVGVAEEVVEKRLDRLEGVGKAPRLVSSAA
jgi:hypothetical protein